VSGRPFEEILVLLAAVVFAVTFFHRIHIPSVLSYLVVGAVIGPHALGLISDIEHIKVFGEFGVVFLLFTIGLNFSLPQIYALRHLVLGLGTAQVLLTTAIVAVAAWAIGLSAAAAFAVGAVFAQSSSTIISKQLSEEGEDETRHGRIGLAMSVFQDVTAVPFIVVIPVLGSAAASLTEPLFWALLKAAVAFALVFVIGRWLFRPLFHQIAARRSSELFTLTVLLISLASAWTTQALGLSMALGAFLAGMMLGETEFRYQIESTIRPFRDVLIGLFFVSIGMLLDLTLLPQIWQWAILSAAGVLLVKTPLVAAITRIAKLEKSTAWRTGIVLAVGGEFGFALLAIALAAGVVTPHHGQIVLTSVLLSMIAAPFLIRYNGSLAYFFSGRTRTEPVNSSPGLPDEVGRLRNHVVICGYGRVGQSIGRFLEEEKIPFIVLDIDSTLVTKASAAGEPVHYGDCTERNVLEAVGVEHARLLLVTPDETGSALKILQHVCSSWPELPVVIRTRDESKVDELRKAGATEVIPETLEAAMMIASHVLLLANVPLMRVIRRIRNLRRGRYPLLKESFGAKPPLQTPVETPAQSVEDDSVR
jgi:monovalent cation:H+ antiporter-2, CPA2 family